MNQLTSTTASTPRSPSAAPRSSGQQTAAILQAAQILEEPWRLSDELFATHPGWYRGLFGELPQIDELRHPDYADRARRKAEDILELLPSEEVLAPLLSSLAKLEGAALDRRHTLALIAAMVAGFPNGRPPDPEAYIQGLLHEVMSAGHKPAVVARATRVLARTSKFLPNISEVLEACATAAEIELSAHRVLAARDRRREVEHMLAEADRLGPRDIEAEWRGHLGRFKEAGEWPMRTPKPDERHCPAPRDLLAEFGYGPEPQSEILGVDGKAVPQW